MGFGLGFAGRREGLSLRYPWFVFYGWCSHCTFLGWRGRTFPPSFSSSTFFLVGRDGVGVVYPRMLLRDLYYIPLFFLGCSFFSLRLLDTMSSFWMHIPLFSGTSRPTYHVHSVHEISMTKGKIQALMDEKIQWNQYSTPSATSQSNKTLQPNRTDLNLKDQKTMFPTNRDSWTKNITQPK